MTATNLTTFEEPSPETSCRPVTMPNITGVDKSTPFYPMYKNSTITKLISCSKVLLENMTVIQLVMKFAVCYGSPIFINCRVHKRTAPYSICPSCTESIILHHISLISILIQESARLTQFIPLDLIKLITEDKKCIQFNQCLSPV